MHCRVCSILCVLGILPLGAGCQSMNYAQRGGVLGGLAGAGIGAAAGESGGDAVPGALIGGAVGALAGSVVGDGMDADRARQAEIEARIGRQLAGAVTSEDAVAMTRAGLSDDVIISHIRAHGVARPLEVNDLIALRNQGVSDAVIKALQTSPGPVAVVRGPPAPRRRARILRSLVGTAAVVPPSSLSASPRRQLGHSSAPLGPQQLRLPPGMRTFQVLTSAAIPWCRGNRRFVG
jgi:hypothetical protein